MKFRLACGHTRKIGPFVNFFTLLREPCMRCLMEQRGAIQTFPGEQPEHIDGQLDLDEVGAGDPIALLPQEDWDENPRYGPGNPDWERDFDKDLEDDR